MVTKDNFEEYALLYADKELTKVEEKALLNFVAQHPELKPELDAYASVVLTPDTNIVFSEKKDLLKESPKASIISFSRHKFYYAAAASVIALLFILFLNNNNTPTNTIAQNSTETNDITQETSHKNKTQKIITSDTPTQPLKPEQHSIAQNTAKLIPSAKPSRVMTEPLQATIVPDEFVTLEESNIAALDVKSATTSIVYKPTLIEKTPGYFESSVAPLFALNETTEGLTELSKIVTNKINNVKNTAKQLKGSDVKLKIGNKEILIATL